jgi:putative transcriptional regulator
VLHDITLLKSGTYLYADPFLDEPPFRRSVVFLALHNHTGSVGFMLQKQMAFELNQLIKEPINSYFPVYYGGPVNTDSLFYIHNLGDQIPGGKVITDNLRLGGDFNSLLVALESGNLTQQNIKFFVGYTGWSAGQLEDEMQEKSWIVAEENPSVLWQQPKYARMWMDKMKSLGPPYSIWGGYSAVPSFN